MEPDSVTYQLYLLGASKSLLRIVLSSQSQKTSITTTCTNRLALSRKRFCFSAGFTVFQFSNSINQRAMKAVKKSMNVETLMKAQHSFPASKIKKKIKAHKATTFKATAYLLTIDIPTHLIHLYSSSGVSDLTGMF